GRHTAAREDKRLVHREERASAKIEPTDIGEPYRQPEWTEERSNRVHPRATGAKQRRKVVEQRMDDRLERDDARVRAWRRGCKCAETVVLPTHVAGAIFAVRDAKTSRVR